MSDSRVSSLANILVNYSIGVQPGEWVFINANTLSLPLAVEVVKSILNAGGHPTMWLTDEAIQEMELEESDEEQLKWVSPLEKMVFNEIDALISLRSSANTRSLTSIEPGKQRIQRQARRELMETYMKRSADGDLRWVITNYPCQAYAQEADMSLKDYEDFVYKATFADQPQPVKAWEKIHAEQKRLIDWLKGKKQVNVSGPNVELSLSIENRTFINSDGHKNMPSGEIFTGPLEDSVNGWVKFTYPAINAGREVDGVELQFTDGKVTKAKASKNEDFLITMLDSDDRARYLGEFAIGTNYGIQKFTKNILYDEKIGGTIHMAVGAGYPETGSINKSSIHWDFICDMRDDSEIFVDGELFYKNGKFLV